MTAVGEAARCATQNDLGRAPTSDLSDVPVVAIFGADRPTAIERNDVIFPGPDAGDADRCRHALPDPDAVSCDQPAPWAGRSWENLVNAAGAERIRRVEARTDEGEPTPGAYSASRSVAYVEVTMVVGDPMNLYSFIQTAFAQCAHGDFQMVEGIPVVVGSTPMAGVGDVPLVAFVTRDRVAWVTLGGRRWSAAERDHALTTIARHLA